MSKDAERRKNLNEEIHKNIKAILEEREGKQLSSDKIADLLEYDRNKYYKQTYEKGKTHCTSISVDDLVSFADMLGCSVDELLGRSGNADSINIKKENPIDFIKKLMFWNANNGNNEAFYVQEGMPFCINFVADYDKAIIELYDKSYVMPAFFNEYKTIEKSFEYLDYLGENEGQRYRKAMIEKAFEKACEIALKIRGNKPL